MPNLKNDWVIFPLANVVRADKPIVYGIVQAGPECPGGVPYIKSTDVRGNIVLSSLSRTTREIADRYRRSVVVPGDIVFSLRGNIGELAIVPPGLLEANLTQGTARISVNDRALNDYIAFALHEPALRRRIIRLGKGSTFQEISLETLRKIEIPLPPLSEQRKIAEILRTWDEAIEKLEALRAANEVHYKAISKRFFDACHPSFHGRPHAWQQYELGDVFHERSQSGEGNDRLLSITMSSGVIDREEVGRKDTSTDDKSNYKLILPGDIGYNTMRMWQGVSGLSALRGIISPAYTVITPISSRILGRYAAHLFKSRRMVFDFERYSQGLTSDTWNLKFPTFSRIKVFLPSIEEQKKQANLLDSLTAEGAVIGKQLETLIRQKRGLMQKLLTGEWRIKVNDQTGRS